MAEGRYGAVDRRYGAAEGREDAVEGRDGAMEGRDGAVMVGSDVAEGRDGAVEGRDGAETFSPGSKTAWDTVTDGFSFGFFSCFEFCFNEDGLTVTSFPHPFPPLLFR